MAETPACTGGFTQEGSSEMFTQLSRLREKDGCVLDTLDTSGSVVTVSWHRADVNVGSLQILPESCTAQSFEPSHALTTAIPKALRNACPATVAAVDAILARLPLPGPMQSGSAPRRERAGGSNAANGFDVWGMVVALAVVLGTVGVWRLIREG